MKEGFASARGHKMFYRSVGSGRPVVFIHAGVADSRMWVPQLESVPDGFRFLAVDQRGYGKTPIGEEVFGSDRDVLSILDFFRLEKAVLAGCSVGGGVAIDVAIRAPERIDGLVLVGANSPGFEPPDGYYESPQWPDAVKAFEAGDFERVARLDAEMWVAGYGRTIEQVDPGAVKLLIEMDQVALRYENLRERLQEVDINARTERIGSIGCPTLVVVGEYDLPDIRAAADDLAKKLSNDPAVVIPDAAHLPGLEQPAAFNHALFDFLSRI
ncbi:MAG: alpha/beta hydrolase [Acidimicrobiia bacterium]|nr:alpha/beta hydrolase [Acidimicrobiia bacterium]MDH3463433.1 alpha/beta hydrolase [Acidimicrobiia bacterium]